MYTRILDIQENRDDTFWCQYIGREFKIRDVGDSDFWEIAGIEINNVRHNLILKFRCDKPYEVSTTLYDPKLSGDPKYLALLENMKQLHLKKSAGYSGDSSDRWANFRLSEQLGVSAFLGCLIRMSDKFIRVQNLIKNPKNEQVGEAITDTLMDLASYALIAVCLYNEDKINKNE